ncbi:TM2 domain-containing protein [Virgibacillus halodenitrificans]|uniref:TM2 domain-containing protein n=1 Tax=Virgibacillus halodenitrificans TaxID=1482 RepID=UPI000EF50478|nr:TM2 domain-containing protein [Virgibacillus halodenitrificans]
MRQLTHEERMLVNSEVSRKGKNMLLSYVLLIFLGTLGIHRFYLGKTGSAITQLVLTILGWMTAIFLVGFLLIAVVGIWLLIDLFLVPGMVESSNKELEEQVIASL